MLLKVTSALLLAQLILFSNPSIAELKSAQAKSTQTQSTQFSASAASVWTLQTSLQQAMSAAPELKKMFAEIEAQKADITLSGLWPDPSIEFRFDNKLGKDDRSGGVDLTDITISQAIPVSRLKYQQSAAEAHLQATQFSQINEAMILQNRVAKIFHQLQFTSAELTMANKRLQLADTFNRQSQNGNRGAVVRYLTPLEKMRLTIIREEASQAAANAEGKYHETLSEFVKLLGIEASSVGGVTELAALETMPELAQLSVLQEQHVLLASQQQVLLAARHEVDVARTSQMHDPTISLSRSQDTFDTGRDDVYALMFNVQIPIHDRKSVAVSKAGYKASQQRIELSRLKRELQINLQRSFTHLHHVVEQATDYQRKVLIPAQKMLDLTQKGFATGELNILSLVDANNTYFEARLRYLDLLYQAWVELAEVRLYAGQQLIDFQPESINFNEGGL